MPLGWLVDTMDIIISFDPRARQTNVRPSQRAVCPLSDNLAHVLTQTTTITVTNTHSHHTHTHMGNCWRDITDWLVQSKNQKCSKSPWLAPCIPNCISRCDDVCCSLLLHPLAAAPHSSPLGSGCSRKTIRLAVTICISAPAGGNV